MGRVTRRVPRIRLDVATGSRAERPDTVVVEEPLEIRVEGSTVATTMRTPGDDFDLAIGHLLTEGLLHSAGEMARLMHCLDDDEHGSPTYNVVDATLAAGARLRHRPRERTEAMTSACGVCGSASVDAVTTTSRYAVDEDPVRLTAGGVLALPGLLRHHQRTFERTGGVHAAGLFTADGVAVAVREDIGRHNAVDKVVGAAARERPLPLTGLVLVVSARASFEIVQKALVAGIPAVVAVSAPSSLAVDLASRAGLTLVAFTRPPSLSVYAGGHRVLP